MQYCASCNKLVYGNINVMNSSLSSVIQKPNKMRLMAIAVGLIIAVPAFSFIYFNAQNFFARASDEVPRDVTISKITNSSANVVWVTDKPTQGVIEYGLNSSELNLFAPELEARREHEVELTLLTVKTTYYFQIRVGNTLYDNAGVPWTFTTRTESGEEAEEQVKGIATRLTQAVQKTSPTVTPTPIDCSKMNCTQVKSYLGRGCSTQDLQRCNLAKNDTSSYASPTSGIYFTPIPSPTSILIDSDACNIKFLTVTQDNCTKWIWDSIASKSKTCREGFYQYLFQCQNKSFSSSDPTIIDNNVIVNYAQNIKTLDITPTPGQTIFCRVRAVDEYGDVDNDSHGTPWSEAQETCK